MNASWKRSPAALAGLTAVVVMALALVLAPAALAASPISLTLDDGSDCYAPGDAVYYTAVLTNESGAPVSGVALDFTYPDAADSGASSWMCAYENATGSFPSDGTGAISGTVDLDAGGSVRLEILCQTLPDASSDLKAVITAQVPDSADFPGGVTESAVDVDLVGVVTTIPVEPGPLSLFKFDDVEVYEPGGVVTYTIIVANTGSEPQLGVGVNDVLPKQIDAANASWECVSKDMATCSPASGSGNVDCSMDIEAGGSVTITVTCPVLEDASGYMTNTVIATLADQSQYVADDTDLDPSDTTDTTADDGSGGTDTTWEEGASTTDAYVTTTAPGGETTEISPEEDSAGSITTVDDIDTGHGRRAMTDPGVWLFAAMALLLAGGVLYAQMRTSRRRG